MSKYTRITRNDCKILRAKLDAALRDFGTDIGIEAIVGNGSFDDMSVTFKVTLKVEGHDPMEKEFRDSAFLYGLSEDDFGREFTLRGETYKICGVKPRATKLPILATNKAGVRYKFPAAAVTAALGKTPNGFRGIA